MVSPFDRFLLIPPNNPTGFAQQSPGLCRLRHYPSPWEWPQAPAGIEAQPAWQAPELKLDDTALPASAVQSCEAKLQIGDNDGTPTPAELLVSNGSGDFDGDGSPDLTEFRLGLIPSDPNSTFTLDVSPGPADTAELSWPSQDGLHFEIRFTEDLSESLADWSVISPITDNDDDGAPTHEWIDADATSPPKRFYRAGLLP